MDKTDRLLLGIITTLFTISVLGLSYLVYDLDKRVRTLEAHVLNLEDVIFEPEGPKKSGIIQTFVDPTEWEPAPEGWPKLKISEFFIDGKLLISICGAPPEGKTRLGCSAVELGSGTCAIYIMESVPELYEAIKEHEVKHCEGHAHKGEQASIEKYQRAYKHWKLIQPYDISYELLAKDISRRFHVSETFSLQIITTAFEVGQRTKTNPFTILAIIRVESGFNPVAQGNQGDIGLMQLHPKWQMDKIIEAGGLLAAWDPDINILIGARVLRKCLNKHHNEVGALQCYNGNERYPGRVINEQIYLKGVASGSTRKSQAANSR